MKFIERNRKSRNSFFNKIPSGVQEIIDNSKEDYIDNYLIEGLSNRVLFEKFINFRWPLWLESSSNYTTVDNRAYSNPLLLNTSFREWQVLTNYLSKSEITIDRVGMISGPNSAVWSLEFWIYNNGNLYRPQNEYGNVSASRSSKTGEIILTWSIDGITFTQKLAGSKSSIDEIIISVEINTKKAGKECFLVAAVRPYNNISLGGLQSIDIDPSAGVISVNGKGLIGFDAVPDEVITGSGLLGDIDRSAVVEGNSIKCSYGLATAGLKYRLNSVKAVYNFRISLDAESHLPQGKFNYASQFKEFGMFSEMRLAEGIKIDSTDDVFLKYFIQSRLSILNINYDDISDNEPESFRKLYFFIYAFCRTGSIDKAEKFFKFRLDNFAYDKKNPVFEDVIKGCFLITSCNQIFIHKRETGFLQTYYPAIKLIAEYIYRFSVEIYSASDFKKSTNPHSFSVDSKISDLLYILSAITDLSYLARCMGIFGDESKFKNESLRLHSLIIESVKTNFSSRTVVSKTVADLFSLPDKVLYMMKLDEYKELLSEFVSSSGYPVIHPLCGIDMFSNAVILNHLFSSGISESTVYYSKLMELLDDYYIIPEYIDPSIKRGTWGDGNSKVINAVIFSILRNRLFIDSQERLELFPVPEASWFKSGSRLSVEDASSRFGVISFVMDVIENEIRLSFGGSPKYLPADILINLPVDTSIIPCDDFIVKKKAGCNYLINGWPASVRFTIL